MASLRTKFSVGLFTIIGFTIATIGIIWLGMSNRFEKGSFYVAYFDESVQGLDRDSAVKYRGVSIGRVVSVKVAPDSKLIEVLLKIESDMKLYEEGIVATLKSVGITGIMFIEIDRKPHTAPDLSPKISFKTRHPVVATTPSGIKQFIKGVDDIFKILTEMDLVGIASRIRTTLDRVDTTLQQANVGEVSSDLRVAIKRIDGILARDKWDNALDSFAKFSKTANTTVSNLDETVTGLNRIINDNKGELNNALTSLNKTINEATEVLNSGTGLLNGADSKLATIESHLLVTLQNLEKSSENLTRLLEEISDQPSRLMFGEPPESRKIEDSGKPFEQAP